MIRRLRGDCDAEPRTEAADAVGRGMADVVAALDNVIDDNAVLGRIYAASGTSVRGEAPARGAAPRPRLALRATVGVAAALTAGAVAWAAVGMPGAVRSGTEGPAVRTADVLKRMDKALDAAEPGAIALLTVTNRSASTRGGESVTTSAQEWSYGDLWRSVTYSPDGHVLYDAGSTAASVYTVVNYQARTWARQPRLVSPATLVPGRRGCEPVVASVPLLFQPGPPVFGPPASWRPATVASSLRAAISCGALVAAGRQRVDGIEAIELTSRPDSMISETIWVSPGTYLPVRVAVRSRPGNLALRETADVTWLRPTAQNRSRLTVPIPSGFRQVPFAAAVRSRMYRVSG